MVPRIIAVPYEMDGRYTALKNALYAAVFVAEGSMDALVTFFSIAEAPLPNVSFFGIMVTLSVSVLGSVESVCVADAPLGRAAVTL